jgi:hypothetical protein
MSAVQPPSSAVPPGDAPPGFGQRFLRALNAGSVGWAIGLAVAVALLLNPIFLTPFPALLGRTLFVALVLVLVFHVAGSWRQRLVPRWLLQTLAVAMAAPVATLLVYLAVTSGNISAFVGNPYRVMGALVRERDAQTRSQALQFEVERSELERQALDARLALLSAQVEPHFLFNTLANVQALVETGSPRAAPVLKSLIAYLRAALPRLHEARDATLADELDLVRAYLELMHLRMPDRLRYEVGVDAALLGTRFPPMALLTLVENAVRHGIDPSEQGGMIEVGGRREAGGRRVALWVADTGVGLRGGGAPGTGLANLRSRLQGVFGASARVELLPNAPRGVRAELSFEEEPKR